MDCKKIEEIILTDYLDGRLDGLALKDLEAHLASCDRCRAFASEAKGVSDAFKNAGQMAPPAMVWERIRAEVSERPAEIASRQNMLEPIRRFFINARPALIAATAAVLILAVLVTGRIASNIRIGVQEDEIFAMVDLGKNANGADYDLGTAAERYFL